MDSYLDVKSLTIYSLGIEQVNTGIETQHVNLNLSKENSGYSPLVFESL